MLTFRDAFHNQVNDRYRENWRHYVSAAAEARSVLFRIGLGFVLNPLPRPGRPRVLEAAGQWPAGSYQVRAAWVNGQGQVSAPSEETAIALAVASGIQVSVSDAPSGAIGWHVYAGEVGGEVYQQNVETLPIGSSWTPSSSGILAGEIPGSGQFADVYIAASARTTPRG
jgi:hypothetical protein